MVKHMWSFLVFLYSLSNGVYVNRLPYSKEQSWSNHNLFSVPLDLDVRLRRLDLSNNFIRHMHTLALPFLEQLDVSSNQLDLISEGFFENLAELEDLNLSRNKLNNNLGSNSKALQFVSGLRSLDISMNSLSDDAVKLYLRNKSSLDQLKMSGNALQRLSHRMFKDSKNLRTISIDNNLISVIEQETFETLTRLEALNLAQNNIAYICDFKLYHLKYLNLSRNSIEFFVTHEDERLYRLEILDLSFNKLLYFPIVPKLNRLRYLYLQKNKIGTLTSEAEMVSEDNALYYDIVDWNLIASEKNYLHANWRLMPLVYIDLSYNHFRAFPLETLSLLSSLETLNFSHNCVQKIIWDIRNDSDRGIFYSSLKHLDLQSNGLVYISHLFLEALTQIETVNLQDNSVQLCPPVDHSPTFKLKPFPNMSCIFFGQLRTLKHLNLRENNIKKLYKNTFERSGLVSLNLANNAHMVMQEGALEGLQKTLQSLTLSELNMESLELALPCMPALTQLNMSNNNFDIVPNFINCSPLTEIDMRNNMLASLNKSLLSNLSKHLEIMYISGNPFNCCDSEWLTILNESNVKLPDISNAECNAGKVKILMTEYVRNPTIYCFVQTNTQQNHIGQIVILVIFLTVLLTVVFIFCKKLICSHMQFIV